ncbi:Acyltransferase GLAUCE-like protein [Drosera capensis]
MGAVYQGPQLPLIDDLMITIQSSKLIFSGQEHHERKSMFLSNIDQVLNFDVQTIHFFAANADFPPETAAKKVAMALQKLQVTYEFLSGRMKMNEETGRFEFDCNNAGVGFVVANSGRSLDEIGDLVYPNPAFEQLVTKTLESLSPGSHPLCIVQMTSFKCGGFAMAVQTNHATFDGLSFKHFLQNLGAIAGDKPLAVTPCNDRELLAARSPPLVTFPHPELLNLNTALGQEAQSSPNVFDNSTSDLDFKAFHLSPDDLSDLKAKASAGPTSGKARITGFNVVSAHIWRCKALSFDSEHNQERDSTLLYAVDIRRRLSPPLPAEFAGNAVLTAYATAKCGDIEDAPLSRLAETVAEGAARMTDEYARSAIDWGELNKGFPNGEFLISSWWRLGFNEVEYPWGKPKYSCPLVYRRKDIILLFPDIEDGSADSGNGGGVNVLVALPHKEMVKFESLFYKF